MGTLGNPWISDIIIPSAYLLIDPAKPHRRVTMKLDHVLCLTKWQTMTLSTYMVSIALYHGYLAAVVASVCMGVLLLFSVGYVGRSFEAVSPVLVEPSTTSHTRRLDRPSKPSSACRTRDVLREFVCVRPETDSEFELSTDDEHFQRPVSSEPSPRELPGKTSEKLRNEADEIIQRARAEAAALTQAAALDCESMLEQTRSQLEDIRSQRACIGTEDANQLSAVEQMNQELNVDIIQLEHAISACVSEHLTGLSFAFMGMQDKLKITVPAKNASRRRPTVSPVVKSPHALVALGPSAVGCGFQSRRLQAASAAPR